MTQPDLVVVGGGILGAACARSLAARGFGVTVLDAGSKPGAATPASAGMLAPLHDAQMQDPTLGLRVRARDLYVSLAPELHAETGVDVGLWTEGILHAAFSETDVVRLKSTGAWQRQQGFSVEWLDATELRERCPGIAPDAVGAALSPEGGALEPLALLEALVRSATAKGAVFQRGERVDALVLEHDRVVGVRASSTTLRPAAVVLAAGCWSGRVGGLPRPLSVEPVRGQMAALAWPPDEPRAIVFSDHGYVLTRGSQAIAGSTMEHVGFDASVTHEGIEHILATARQVYPALESAAVERTWAGLRPGTPDGRPIVGRDPTVENLWYATGHGRNGILLAAITGEIIGALAKGEEVEHDITSLSPGRFWAS